MSEFSKEVAEKYRSLFKGYYFNFEGLKERTKEGFVKLVKEMGAKVSENAEVTFVQQSYFQKNENNTKNNLYDINYIMEAVKNVDASNLLKHRFSPSHAHQVSNDEPMCHTAQYILKTDSCHKCYYEKVFCKECAKSNEKPQKDTNQHTEAIAIYSNATDLSSEYEDEIPRTPEKKVGKSKSESSKRLISSKSSDDSNDEEQSKSVNGKSKSPPRKKLKNSSDTDKTFDECKSPEIHVKNNDSRSDRDSSNNSGKERNGESTKKISKEINSPIKQRAVTSNSNASSIEEDDDLSDSTVNENQKQPEKIDKNRSGWIIPSKSKSPPRRKEEAVESSSSDEGDNDFTIIDSEDQAYFRGKQWWLPHEIPEGEQCTFPQCSFEPESHPTHFKPRKFLSLIEKKIIVKYLIQNNKIPYAKGKTVYENMIRDGYLSHRSWETLRNCFRRTIVKELEIYKLDKTILKNFLSLSDKKCIP